MRDPYEVLEIPPTAGETEIRAAYRRLVKECHPDRHSGSELMRNRFEEVTAAYEILRTNLKKAETNKARPNPRSTSRTPPRAESPPRSNRKSQQTERVSELNPSAQEKAFNDDLLGEFFGGIRNVGKRAFRARGDDQTYRLNISFLEAACGGSRRLKLPTGKMLDIMIPAGVEHEQQIRLKGQGGSGFGGAPAGDALIVVLIDDHQDFRREGLDIHVDLAISLREAVLGANVTVPTIHGPVTLTIPEGTNSGARLRLKGKGINKPSGDKTVSGDQYVTVFVRLPDRPDDSLVKFLKTWRQGILHNPRATPDKA